VKIADVAVPEPFVDAVVIPPAKDPLAPLVGAAKATIAPVTGLPPESFTVATSGNPKAVPMPAVCGVPLVAVMDAGVACAAMVSVNVAVAVTGGVLLSVTVNPSDTFATVAVGVPLIRPVDAFSIRPLGNIPDVSCHEYGTVPPVAPSVWEYAVLTCPLLSDLVVMVSGEGNGGAVPPQFLTRR